MPVDTRIQLRKGTASSWASTNPVLASGEPGYDTTNNILKIGNGVTSWSSLSGLAGSSSSGLANIVEDLSPQLGGQLDLNGYSISGQSFYTSPSGTIIGSDGWIYQSGQFVRSEGNFTTDGDAQASQFILKGSTTNNTWTSLTNNGTAAVLLTSNRTYTFTINIVGRSTNQYKNAAYKLEGLLYNDDSGLSLIGTPIKTILGEDDNSWDVRVLASGTGNSGSDYLFTQVSGATSHNINWVAQVDLLEVGGVVDNGGAIVYMSINSGANILRHNLDFIP